MSKPLEGKNIAMVIAFRDFSDPECFISRNVLLGAGAKITIVSSQKGLAIGADGGEAQVNLTSSEFKVENFDAVVFIGGPGMGGKLDERFSENCQRDHRSK